MLPATQQRRSAAAAACLTADVTAGKVSMVRNVLPERGKLYPPPLCIAPGKRFSHAAVLDLYPPHHIERQSDEMGAARGSERSLGEQSAPRRSVSSMSPNNGNVNEMQRN